MNIGNLITAVLTGIALTAPASNITVLNLADSGEGSLRQAVLDANTLLGSDTIHFAHGLQGTIALTTGQLSITDDLTINGPGANQLALSGNHQSRIFMITGGATVAISGLTIKEGWVTGSPAQGGGILNNASTLALSQVVLTNNQAVGVAGGAGRGGAIANISGATLAVTDCQFALNQGIGGSGGGVGNSGGIVNLASHLTVSRSTFNDNLAIGGNGGGQALAGGISNAMGADGSITDSTFIGNQAIAGDGSGGNGFGLGGGIYNNRSTLTVEHCTLCENLARGGNNNLRSDRLVSPAAGGGIFNAEQSTLVLTASTVSGNRALGGSNNTCTGGNADVGTAFGGGLNNVATATVNDCVFEHNEAIGGSGNQGDNVSFQFVGTGTGGGIATSARSSAGFHVSLVLNNVTVRHNLAVGGDGNTAGTIVDAGIGGGLGNNGSNPFVPISAGSEVTMQNCMVQHNQAIGGSGGAALGGGVANTLGGMVIGSGVVLNQNRSFGGAGGATEDGGSGAGGGIYNDGASTHPSNPGVPTILIAAGCQITANSALGGAAGNASAAGGVGAGGALWNGGISSLKGTAINRNRAIGGDGINGGDGLGGGAYNEPLSAIMLDHSSVTDNHANAGDGYNSEGIGGGIYFLGLFEPDVFSMISQNHASTSNNDIFGM